eukprot:3933519-Rhodomonas_salina.4
MATSMEIQFCEAADNDECCINLSNIKECAVDFLPSSKTLFQDEPTLDKATILHCGHTFHALSLIYHLLRNTMACPVCRHGDLLWQLSLLSFKGNKIVDHLHKRVKRLQKEESAQEIEEETRQLSTLFNTETVSFAITSDILQISPYISFFSFPSTNDLSHPNATFNSPMRNAPVEDNPFPESENPVDHLDYSISSSDARRLSAVLNSNDTENDRNPFTQTPTTLACTPPFKLSSIPAEGTTLLSTNNNNSFFHIKVFHGATQTLTTLQSIHFHIPFDSLWNATIVQMFQQ